MGRRVRSGHGWHPTDPGINPGICEASAPYQERIIRQLGFLPPKAETGGPAGERQSGQSLEKEKSINVSRKGTRLAFSCMNGARRELVAVGGVLWVKDGHCLGVGHTLGYASHTYTR